MLQCVQCVAVCCSVLQCVAVCCSVLQCVVVCCSVLQCVAVCCSVKRNAAFCNVLQYVAVCCSVLQCTLQVGSGHMLAYCSVLQYVTVCCSVSQCVAVCCSMFLQTGSSAPANWNFIYCLQTMNTVSRQLVKQFDHQKQANCRSVLQCVAVCCNCREANCLIFLIQSTNVGKPIHLGHQLSRANPTQK